MDEATAAVRAAAKTWFGYGTWSAPFWFVGMEQGGDPEQASYLPGGNLEVASCSIVASTIWQSMARCSSGGTVAQNLAFSRLGVA